MPLPIPRRRGKVPTPTRRSDLSPEAEQVLQALERGQRAEIAPMPIPARWRSSEQGAQQQGEQPAHDQP